MKNYLTGAALAFCTFLIPATAWAGTFDPIYDTGHDGDYHVTLSDVADLTDKTFTPFVISDMVPGDTSTIKFDYLNKAVVAGNLDLYITQVTTLSDVRKPYYSEVFLQTADGKKISVKALTDYLASEANAKYLLHSVRLLPGKALTNEIKWVFPSESTGGNSLKTGQDGFTLHLSARIVGGVPGIKITKTADVHGDVPATTDTVSYKFVVENIGDEPLTSIVIHDSKVPNVTCPATTLAIGAKMTCTGTWAGIPAVELEDGFIDNRATVTGVGLGHEPVTDDDESRVPVVVGHPKIKLTKTAELTEEGVSPLVESVNYKFLVENVGDEPLNSITLKDSKIAKIDCPATVLALGAKMTCTGTWAGIPATEFEDGSLDNEATVTGLGLDKNKPVTAQSESRVPVGLPYPAIELIKSSKVETVSAAGEDIDYIFTLINTGNQPLFEVAVTDPKISNVNCPATTLLKGQQIVCTGTWGNVPQSELDDGHADNTARVVGKTQDGVKVDATDSYSIPVKLTTKVSSAIAKTKIGGKLAKTGIDPLAALIGLSAVVVGGVIVLISRNRKNTSEVQHDETE